MGAHLKALLAQDRVVKVFALGQFWFDDPGSEEKGLLRIAPHEQQALWIARAFKGLPRLITFAWGENPEFMTEEVKAVLAARVQATVPGSGDEDEDQDEDEAPK